MTMCTIVPPDLLKRLAADSNATEKRAILKTLRIDQGLRRVRSIGLRAAAAAPLPAAVPNKKAKPKRAVYDQMAASDTFLRKLARGEGAKAVKDPAVNEAYNGFGSTHGFFAKHFGWDSMDGRGMQMLGLVHYGQNYDNAFWDGQHMVFGDGDGTLFTRFTKSLDVIAHELTHGVTEHTCGLIYRGQPGALNESVSDVFGVLVKQYKLKQDAAAADWLIGADIVGPELSPALRSMKAPGTANKYDDQPSTMDGFVKTTADNGGVHTNSGIPNYAFYLLATSLGGFAWATAGKIWWATITDATLKPNATFKAFAQITVKQAGVLFGATSAEAEATTGAWQAVKVL